MSSSSDVLPGSSAADRPWTATERERRTRELHVRRILPGEPLGDVLRLRREVYFQERGLQASHTPDRASEPHRHSRRVTDGLDASGTTLVVEGAQQAVATLRLHDFSSLAAQVEYGSLFQLDAFARSWPLHALAVGT